ncbi:hypothetical protein JXK06_01040 [Patescibacteria group bacterium]|nr:hypothetical protein [Patescibacteria group bacterium]
MEILNKAKKVNKSLLIFIFFLILALLIFLVISLKLERNAINEKEQLINEQNQNVDNLNEETIPNEEAQINTETLTAEDLELLITNRENYLKENISNFSPAEAVLGGTFYITEINWSEDGSVAQIKYEDGHIALEAEALFADDVAPTSFVITKEN